MKTCCDPIIIPKALAPARPSCCGDPPSGGTACQVCLAHPHSQLRTPDVPAAAKGSGASARPSRQRPHAAGSPLAALGTVHSDPDGFSKTLSFLEQYKPDLLLVEISEFALKFRHARAARLTNIFIERLHAVSQKLDIPYASALEHPQIAAIFRQINLPFEYRACSEYAKKTGAPPVPVDYSEFSRHWIKTWPEMLSAGNIEILLGTENAAPPVATLYARAARRVYEGETFPEALHHDAPLWREREKYMAQTIIAALKRFTPERPLFIGGWWHLSRGGTIETLRELLAIDETSCFLPGTVSREP